jgi:hypothetical protein
MTLATIALAVILPATAPAAPAKVTPMTVEVRTAPKAGPGAETWAKELRAALETRKEEFRLAKPGEKAELVVRIDSVGKGRGEAQIMNGALVIGQATRPFNLSYNGASRPQAEALARNLRKYADQMKAAPAVR